MNLVRRFHGHYPLQRLTFWAVFMVGVLLSSMAALAETPDRITYATHDQEWFPIMYKNAKGDYVGPWQDRLSMLFDDILDVELKITRQPWKRAQHDVEQGFADFMITLPTDERLAYATPVPGNFFSLEFRLLLRKNLPDFEKYQSIDSLDDIRELGLTLVTTNGNGWYEAHVAGKGIKTEYVDTDEQQILFLQYGRADGMIDIPVTIRPLLERMHALEQLRFLPAVFEHTDFRIMVSQKSPWHDHIDQLAAGIETLNDRLPME